MRYGERQEEVLLLWKQRVQLVKDRITSQHPNRDEVSRTRYIVSIALVDQRLRDDWGVEL